jgi:hypothetical protein
MGIGLLTVTEANSLTRYPFVEPLRGKACHISAVHPRVRSPLADHYQARSRVNRAAVEALSGSR